MVLIKGSRSIAVLGDGPLADAVVRSRLQTKGVLDGVLDVVIDAGAPVSEGVCLRPRIWTAPARGIGFVPYRLDRVLHRWIWVPTWRAPRLCEGHYRVGRVCSLCGSHPSGLGFGDIRLVGC